MMGYFLFGSLVFFIVGHYKFATDFWTSQIFLALSAFCFMYIVIKHWGNEMIKYKCSNCGSTFRGGAEDKVCPLCGKKLMVTGVE